MYPAGYILSRQGQPFFYKEKQEWKSQDGPRSIFLTQGGHLERQGTPIGSLDMLIAAHALAADHTLVTNNEKNFRHVPDLTVENWDDLDDFPPLFYALLRIINDKNTGADTCFGTRLTDIL